MEKEKMNILIANDDGIRAEGIKELARLAKRLGKVTVVAPAHECSGMSHRISYKQELLLRKVDHFLDDVDAYSITGTPADCVRVAMECILEEKPDYVFTGINKGYNIAQEILYSGTVGAAMEGLLYDVPAIAFSQFNFKDFSALETYFDEIFEEIKKRGVGERQIWNVNVPDCSAQEIQGIDYDCKPARLSFYHDHFEVEKLGERMHRINEIYTRKDQAEEGTDCAALLKNYISVGRLNSIV